MKYRRVGIMLGVLASGAAVYGLIFSGDHDAVRDGAPQSNQSRQAEIIDPESSELSADHYLIETNDAIAELNVVSQGADDIPHISEQDGGELQDDQDEGLEGYYMSGSSIDYEHISELRHDDKFTDLVAQLSQQNDPIAAEARRSHELLFYSLEQSRDGSVSLDAFECGARFCAAELRSSDQQAIDKFISDATNSSEFRGNAIVELVGSRADGEFRRLIFAHDSTIESITIPAEILADQMK